MPEKQPGPCPHRRTQLIAKDRPAEAGEASGAEYVECLDCGAILEAGELKEGAGFGESLSDA